MSKDRTQAIPAFIDLAAQRERLGDRLDQAVLAVLRHGQYVLGPEVAELERQAWLMRVVHVAPDREAAVRAVEAPFMGYQEKMSKLRSDSTGGSVPGSFDRSLLRLRTFGDYLADDWMVVGTPDDVRDGLQKHLDATGYQRVMLLMDLPGIEVRPIETLLGSSEFCEVFFDDVRVPVDQRVGAENDGWRVTNVTLSFERGTAFVSEMVDALRLAEELAPSVHDPAERRELAHVVAELDALWALTKRNVSQAAAHARPRAAAFGDRQGTVDLGGDDVDRAAEPLADDLAPEQRQRFERDVEALHRQRRRLELDWRRRK